MCSLYWLFKNPFNFLDLFCFFLCSYFSSYKSSSLYRRWCWVIWCIGSHNYYSWSYKVPFFSFRAFCLELYLEVVVFPDILLFILLYLIFLNYFVLGMYFRIQHKIGCCFVIQPENIFLFLFKQITFICYYWYVRYIWPQLYHIILF